MTDIITLGELLIDFTSCGKNEQGQRLFAQNPGGAPANVAVAVARLGGKSAFVGKNQAQEHHSKKRHHFPFLFSFFPL